MTENISWKKPEIIVAIMSAIIAICAIYIAFNEGQATRKHNKLSVRPILKVTQTTDDKSTKLHLENSGLGPAIIDRIRINYHGKTIEPTTENWKIIFNGLGIGKYTMTLLDGDQTVIKPDKEGIIVEVEHNAKYSGIIEKCFSEIETTVYYRSLYDETDAFTFKAAKK